MNRQPTVCVFICTCGWEWEWCAHTRVSVIYRNLHAERTMASKTVIVIIDSLISIPMHDCQWLNEWIENVLIVSKRAEPISMLFSITCFRGPTFTVILSCTVSCRVWVDSDSSKRTRCETPASIPSLHSVMPGNFLQAAVPFLAELTCEHATQLEMVKIVQYPMFAENSILANFRQQNALLRRWHLFWIVNKRHFSKIC